MNAVKITYFKEMNVKHKGRVLDLVGQSIPQIVASAAHHMAADEAFACFTAPDGCVVALDKQSQFVMV